MANYVKNVVRCLFKTEKAAQEFIKSINGEDGEFSFNSIVPMRKELLIKEPCEDELRVYLYKHPEAREDLKVAAYLDEHPLSSYGETFTILLQQYNEMPKAMVYDEEKNGRNHMLCLIDATLSDKFYETQEEFDLAGYFAIENIKATGFATWYEWRKHYWGVKWDASDSDVDYTEVDDGMIQVEIIFETPWETPTPLIEAMSKKYPDLTFDVEYADEDLGNNCGSYTYSAGELIESDDISETDSYENAFAFACSLWGYDPDEARSWRDDDPS